MMRTHAGRLLVLAGKLLASRRRRAREKNGVPFALLFFKHFEHALVIQICIVIVHAHGIAAIEVNYILDGDPLAKVGFDAVDSV